MRRLYISTYGCQMNVRDSEEVVGLLLEKGYALTESDKQADVILLNTCSVREHAEDKVWSLLGALREEKQQRPELIIGNFGYRFRTLGTVSGSAGLKVGNPAHLEMVPICALAAT